MNAIVFKLVHDKKNEIQVQYMCRALDVHINNNN